MGRPGDGATCTRGFPVRVPSVVQGLAPVGPAAVRVGDIWAREAGHGEEAHCGIVSSVTPGVPGSPPVIGIDNDSSGNGRVLQSDWGQDFHHRGQFYRWP